MQKLLQLLKINNNKLEVQTVLFINQLPFGIQVIAKILLILWLLYLILLKILKAKFIKKLASIIIQIM